MATAICDCCNEIIVLCVKCEVLEAESNGWCELCIEDEAGGSSV